MILPTPQELGLPSKYKEWRPNQDKAIVDGLECHKTIAVQVQRQGRGKSLTFMTQAVLSTRQKKRAVILTTNKGLQDQMLAEWSNYGLKDIRGKVGYSCDGMPGHTCEQGILARCMYKGTSMCGHHNAKTEAGIADMLVTNYSCWIASHKNGRGFGHFDVMICDEGHSIPAEVAKAMRIQLTDREITDTMQLDWPDDSARRDLAAWKHWAKVAFNLCDSRLTSLKLEMERTTKPLAAKVKHLDTLEKLSRKLADLASCKPAIWVVDTTAYGYQFDPIDSSGRVKDLVFRDCEKVILTSGSIRPKTCELMGLEPDEYQYYEYPSESDADRSPVMHLTTGVKMSRNTQPYELKRIVRYIDRIIDARLDRKGIIHGISFPLSQFIYQHTQHRKLMVTNQRGQNITDTLENFRSRRGAAVLLSPSVTTGYDFPYDQCRYQILPKMPFPDMGSSIVRAKMAKDRNYLGHEMMQTFSQMVGRGDRGDDDWQEFFVLDDNFTNAMWFNQEYAPIWLPALVMEINELPEPPALKAA